MVTNCLLILKLVSDKLELSPVNNVLTTLYGNLNIAVFFSELWSFALLLLYVLDVAVAVPNPTDVSNIVLEWILSMILVVTDPPSSTNSILSPILKSLKNLVPEPTSLSDWSAGGSKPTPNTISLDSVASSKTNVSPAFAELASVPSSITLPCDSVALTVETVPDNCKTSPLTESNETLAV